MRKIIPIILLSCLLLGCENQVAEEVAEKPDDVVEVEEVTPTPIIEEIIEDVVEDYSELFLDIVSDTPPEYWNELNELSKIVPYPAIPDGEVLVDNGNFYNVFYDNVTEQEYRKYVKACIANRLNNYDSFSDNDFYGTYNGDIAYQIKYVSSTSDMSIRIHRIDNDYPVVTEDNVPDYWDSSNPLSSIFPIPNYEYGTQLVSRDDLYEIDSYNVTPEQYKKYVDAFILTCEDEYDRDSTLFFLNKPTGEHIQITYSEDHARMFIRVSVH